MPRLCRVSLPLPQEGSGQRRPHMPKGLPRFCRGQSGLPRPGRAGTVVAGGRGSRVSEHIVGKCRAGAAFLRSPSGSRSLEPQAIATLPRLFRSCAVVLPGCAAALPRCFFPLPPEGALGRGGPTCLRVCRSFATVCLLCRSVTAKAGAASLPRFCRGARVYEASPGAHESPRTPPRHA